MDARATGCGPCMAPIHQPPIRPGDGQRNAAARILQRLSRPGLPLPGEWLTLTIRVHGALEADSIYTPRYNLPAQTLSRATRPRTCGTSLPCVKILKSPVDRCSANEGHTRAGRRHRRAHRQGDCPAPHVLRGLWRLPGGDGGDRGETGLHGLYKVRVHQAPALRGPGRTQTDRRAPTCPIDTSLISASPRTGLAYRSPLPRACWAMAPSRRCCMETRSLSGKGTITGTGSRTTLPMTTCKP